MTDLSSIFTLAGMIASAWLLLVIAYNGHEAASRSSWDAMQRDHARRMASAKDGDERSMLESSLAMWCATRPTPVARWWP